MHPEAHSFTSLEIRVDSKEKKSKRNGVRMAEAPEGEDRGRKDRDCKDGNI